MGYVFISYSSKNIEKADAVRNVFHNIGIETWMAPYDVPAGCRYAEAITNAIDDSGCFCLILSKDSQESDAVDSEVNLAKSRKTPKLPFVIIKIEEMAVNAAFRYYISNKQIETVLDINEESEGLKKIIASVKAYLGVDSCEPIKTKKSESVTYSDGSVYYGEMVNGKKHGRGKYVYSNGCVYEGGWENDTVCGNGRYTWPNGTVFEGFWSNGKINGMGKCIWPDKTVYEGEYLNDKKHGKGKMTYPDGTVWEGFWKDDKFLG